MSVSDLWWLPENVDWSDEVRSLGGAAGWDRFVSLANCRMDFLRTERLDKLARKNFGDHPPTGLTLPIVRLAVLSSSMVSHLIPAIRVALMRRGMWAEIYTNPFGQYLQDLMDPASALHAFKPNAILFAFDARHALGKANASRDAAASDRTVEDSADHCTHVWNMARQAFACPIIQQTILPLFPALLGSNEHRLPGSPQAMTQRINQRIRQRADEAGVDILAIDARANLDPLLSLIDQVKPVLDSQNNTSGAIQAWAANLATVTGELQAQDKAVGTLLDKGGPAFGEMGQLFNRLRPTLPILLQNLVSINKVAITYQPNLEQLLVLLPRTTEAAQGVTTGISAADRARTVQAAVAKNATQHDIVQPGHIFPLMAQNGGVLVRAGHTEAGCDLAALTGHEPAAVICEIMNDDGTMARLPELIAFGRQHGLKIGTIADLIAYRRKYDHPIKREIETEIESEYGGKFKLYLYVNTLEYAEHIALVKGDVTAPGPVPVRMHALNVFDDLFAAKGGRNDLLRQSMREIARDGRGVIVLIRDTKDTAISEYLRGYDDIEAQRSGLLKEYGVGAQILLDLGIKEMELMTRSQGKTIVGIDGYGLTVTGYRNIPKEES